MGQQTQDSGRSTLMNPSSVPPVEVDYIVCGLCQRDFPLANIVSFVQHKKFDCDDFRDFQGFRSRILLCKSCPRKFNTPWRLLQHAQSVHSLHIYLEQAELLPPNSSVILTQPPQTTSHEISPTDTRVLTSANLHQVLLNKANLNLHNYSLAVSQPGNPGVVLQQKHESAWTDMLEQVNTIPIKETDIYEDSELSSVIPESKELATTEVLDTSFVSTSEQDTLFNVDLSEPVNTVTSSGQNPSKVDEVPAVSGAENPSEKTQEDLEDEGDKCCDNMDCGITLMPGTHEEPKKCCNAVVPKKRKRHMQTKHKSATGRLSRRSTGEKHKPRTQTVFIDIDPSMVEDSPDSSPIKQRHPATAGHMPVSTENSSIENVGNEVEINSNERTGYLEDKVQGIPKSSVSSSAMVEVKTEGQDISQFSDPPVSQKGTYIIEPGTTFSIPVSGNVDLSSVFSNLSIPQSVLLSNGNGPNSEQLGKNYTTTRFGGEDSEDTSGFIDISTSASPSQMLEEDKAMTDTGSNEIGIPHFEGNKSFLPRKCPEFAYKRKDQGTRLSGFGDLADRRRRYPTSKPFKCDKCNQAFNQRIHLKKHQSKHTGIKPFQCEQCDYSTVEKSHLKVHIRVHTGEKPFKCTYCEYATAQNSTLKIHLKRHLQGTGGVRCLQCRKEFDKPECLTSHSKTEHNQQALRQVIIMPDNQAVVPEPDNQAVAPDDQVIASNNQADQAGQAGHDESDLLRREATEKDGDTMDNKEHDINVLNTNGKANL